MRDFCGLRHPDEGDAIIVEGHAVAAVVEPPSCRPFTGICAYFYDGQGLSKENMHLAASIGDHILAQGSEKPLYLVGADFNMEPEVLARARLADRVGGEIIAPSSTRRTCRTRTSARTYDYFYAATPLAELIADVATEEGTGIRTHVPVTATFYPRPAALRALGIRQPPKLPTERVFGPLPPPTPGWSALRKAAEEVCAMARDWHHEDEVMNKLDAVYATWADYAERELEDNTGSSVPKHGCRSAPPSVAWRSILPERGGGVNGAGNYDAAKPAAAWAWLADLLRDATRLTQPPGTKHWAGGSGDAQRDQHQHHRRHRNRERDELQEDRALATALLVAIDSEANKFVHVEGVKAATGETLDALRQVHSLCWQSRRTRARREEQRKEINIMLEELLRRARAEHDKAVGAARSTGLDAWRRWILDGFAAGARNAHLYSKLPVQWKPTEVTTPTGARASDPLSVLESQRAKYGQLWKASDRPGVQMGRARCIGASLGRGNP